ncbi:transmembrane protein 44 [Emydura macquarii macquarii]|uniref:transmembrane protein 44 n=1 Tax=Emydura macquarii macquarii TaxID=1129001 RepID=UPI00352B472F
MARAAAAPQAPAPAPAPARSGAALRGWGQLAACLARDPACASAALGALAGLLWVAAHARLVHARCRRRGWQDASVPCIVYSFVGSMCNTIGAVLAHQLAIQIVTGAYMAAVDILRFLLTLFPVCASGPDLPGRRKRRRRQVRGGLFALAVPLCSGPGWYVLATAASSSPKEFHGTDRRLLGTALQESTEVLGFALGMLAALVALTARIPSLSGACRGRLSPGTQLWASVSSALASVLYAAAVVVHDQRPAYVVRAMPWLLLSLGSAGLDVAIAFLSCVMRSQRSRQLGLVAAAPGTQDTWALLAQAEEEEEPKGSEEEKVSPLLSGWRGRAGFCPLCCPARGARWGSDPPRHDPCGCLAEAPEWLPLSMFPAAKCPPAGTAVGRCLALTLEQVQQAGCGSMRLPGDGQTSAAEPALPEPPAYPPVQVTRAELSSSSSADASSVSFELEWDFGDMNLQWNRLGTAVPDIQPSSSSWLNAGCLFDANTLKQTAAAPRLCENDTP